MEDEEVRHNESNEPPSLQELQRNGFNRTYADWNRMGLRVHRGSKAVGFNDNREALFSSKQVYDPMELSTAEMDYALRAMEWEEMPH